MAPRIGYQLRAKASFYHAENLHDLVQATLRLSESTRIRNYKASLPSTAVEAISTVEVHNIAAIYRGLN
ncbi:MAG: hypothetical protein OXC63_07885 [Aestuariivita sp.]|nr:hypothetical protein [Aestuariivita sp.]MCY4347080.1 hypothetical protein [Aestuariivita sp.]